MVEGERLTIPTSLKMALSNSNLSDIEYLGETSARPYHVATLLTFLCPGVGYMYVGRLIKGITVNFLFVLLVELFIILMTWLKFFPLLPLLVLLLSWFVFCALAALDVRDIIREEELEHEYLLQPYNHWMFYALVATLTYLTPMVVSVELTERHLITVAPIKHAGMYPTLLPGDQVLIDRLGIQKDGPQRGDVVAVSADKPDAPMHILRVVALGGDIIRVEGDMLYLDDEPLDRIPYESTTDILEKPGMLAMVEHNEDVRYLIAMANHGITNISIAPVKLGKQRMFLLTDNRSQIPLGNERAKIRDSRNFGSLSVDKLRGAPRYILWSQDPDTGDIRWDRIGLRIH